MRHETTRTFSQSNRFASPNRPGWLHSVTNPGPGAVANQIPRTSRAGRKMMALTNSSTPPTANQPRGTATAAAIRTDKARGPPGPAANTGPAECKTGGTLPWFHRLKAGVCARSDPSINTSARRERFPERSKWASGRGSTRWRSRFQPAWGDTALYVGQAARRTYRCRRCSKTIHRRRENTAMPCISSGVPSRPSGTASRNSSRVFGSERM